MNATEKRLVRAALNKRINAAIDRNNRQPNRYRGGIPDVLQDADEYVRGISIHPENAERGRVVCEALLDAIRRGEDVLTCRLTVRRPAVRRAA